MQERTNPRRRFAVFPRRFDLAQQRARAFARKVRAVGSGKSGSAAEATAGLGSVFEAELRYVCEHAPHPRQAERQAARERVTRAHHTDGAPDPVQLRDAVLGDPDLRLAGLALSGGGIRSASFCLGVLQSLARARLLSRFDYLSSVSGGGYILGWLLAWCYRTPGSLPAVEKILADRAAPHEPEPLRHLRRYAVYLAPNGGMLSSDLWGLMTAYLRNLAVTLTFALPLLLVPVLGLHLLFTGVRFAIEHHAAWWQHFGFATVLTLAAAEIFAMRMFARDVVPWVRFDPAAASRALLGVHLFVGGTIAVFFLLVPRGGLDWSDAFKAVAALVVFVVVTLIGERVRPRRRPAHDESTVRRGVLRPLLGAVLSAFAFIALTGALHAWIGVAPGSAPSVVAWHLPFVPLAWSLIVAVPELVHQLIMSQQMTDADREWTARYTGIMLLGALLCTLGSLMVMVLPAWLLTGPDDLSRPLAAAGLALLAAVALWRRWTGLLLLMAAFGLALGVCLRAFVRVGPFDPLAVLGPSVIGTAAGIVLLIVAIVAVDRFVNINRFSLHAIYRNRLSRTFLGASRPLDDLGRACHAEERTQFVPRDPGAFQDFDADDNPRLRWLKQREDSPDETGWLPVALFNASLNTTWTITQAGRRAKSYPFTFSQFHCGSPETGYCRSEAYASTSGGISLATAMATSGAALSSRSGQLDSRVLAFLKTIFNLRLGWWLGNPGVPRARGGSAPRYSMQAFCAELLGRGLRSRDWIHLSDGGHFENLAVFSLLQRGCADIVCIDAGADPERVCSDLSRLMLLAREELNVDLVQLSTWQIGLPELGPQGRHCALFQIDYPNGRQGRMLYIKTALYDGGEIAPVDAVSYWKQHPAFPHESTVNQFFTDAQFEAYRRLGEQTVQRLLAQPTPGAPTIDDLFVGAQRHLEPRVGGGDSA